VVEPFIIDTVVLASLYALMSIGLTLTYMTTKVPNFAHGSFITIGAYIAFSLNTFMRVTPYTSSLLSFVVGGASAVAMYRLVLKPMSKRGASTVTLMIATLAIDIFFVGIFGMYSDYLIRSLAVRNSKLFTLISSDFDIAGIRGSLMAAPLILAAVAIVLHVALTRTKFGTAMRAVVENPNLAGVVGINVNRIYFASWFIAGGLAGAAGSIMTVRFSGSPDVGSQLIVVIFASSVVGGFASVYGAILGGIVIGGSQILLTVYASDLLGSWVSAYAFGVPLMMMILTLLLAPNGITSVKWRRG